MSTNADNMMRRCGSCVCIEDGCGAFFEFLRLRLSVSCLEQQSVLLENYRNGIAIWAVTHRQLTLIHWLSPCVVALDPVQVRQILQGAPDTPVVLLCLFKRIHEELQRLRVVALSYRLPAGFCVSVPTFFRKRPPLSNVMLLICTLESNPRVLWSCTPAAGDDEGGGA